MTDFYAPQPSRVKTVVVTEFNGTGTTYPDLLSAIAAVYRLSPAAHQIIADFVNESQYLDQFNPARQRQGKIV